eukprot:5935083-Pyramimonas_sp.AAC.1
MGDVGSRANDRTEENGPVHVRRVRFADASTDPRRLRGGALLYVAEKKLTDKPALPAFTAGGEAVCHEGAPSTGAVVLPKKHCSLSSCPWHGLTDADLCARMLKERRSDLECVASTLAC